MPPFIPPSLRILIWKEFQLAYRDRIMVTMAIIIYTLFTVSSLLTIFQYRADQQKRQLSKSMFRHQWEAQHTNPHDAAHFGTYLFKPLNMLSAFDPGLNDYFGTTYRVEAHIQHEVDESSAENNDAQMRFGSFTLALILQLLVPLLILFASSSALTAEKESGTFKMLMAQGASMARLTWSKVLSYYLFSVLLVLPVFVFLFFILLSAPSGNQLLARFFITLLGYLLFYLIVVLSGVLISSLSGHSGTAMMAVLSLWLFCGILMPKIAAGMAAQRYPLISRAEFNDKVRNGYLKGLNGEGTLQERGEAYVNYLSKKYPADPADPAGRQAVNIDGLVLQYHEDYQNKVFDHYYAQLEKTFDRQQSYLRYSGLWNPFMSLKRLSMAMSGTDFDHHLRFFIRAKNYRNALIRQLNLQLANHPMKPNERYVAEPGFFKKLKDFPDELPPVLKVLSGQGMALISICCWVLLLSLGLHFTSKSTLL